MGRGWGLLGDRGAGTGDTPWNMQSGKGDPGQMPKVQKAQPSWDIEGKAQVSSPRATM